MTEIDKLRRDAEGLFESIRIAWIELGTPNLAIERRKGILTHMQWAYQELGGLLAEIDGQFDPCNSE